jgi:signal transduction histidine kinase
MINDLLDVSRLEAHHLKLNRREVVLQPLVREIAGQLANVLEGRPLRVIEPKAPLLLRLDPDRLMQILGNLLSNAVKYGAAGTPIVLRIDEQPTSLRFAVTNFGHGIPPEQLPRLFSRFERSWAATESGVSGIGLGLYITKGLIEAHGGRIWVESTPGATTTFSFELPWDQARLPELPEGATPQHGGPAHA